MLVYLYVTSCHFRLVMAVRFWKPVDVFVEYISTRSMVIVIRKLFQPAVFAICRRDCHVAFAALLRFLGRRSAWRPLIERIDLM